MTLCKILICSKMKSTKKAEQLIASISKLSSEKVLMFSPSDKVNDMYFDQRLPILLILIGLKNVPKNVPNNYTKIFKFNENIQVDELVYEVASYLENFYKIPKLVSVVVFDLDDTIIDENDKLLYSGILEEIKTITSYFDYSVLWSHGLSTHVMRNVERYKLDRIFDHIMYRNINVEDNNKSVGTVLQQLNQLYEVTGFTFTVLFDDLELNNIGDYDVQYKIPRHMGESYYEEYYTSIKNNLPKIMKDIVNYYKSSKMLVM